MPLVEGDFLVVVSTGMICGGNVEDNICLRTFFLEEKDVHWWAEFPDRQPKYLDTFLEM